MKTTISRVRPNDKVKVIDGELLSKFPRLKSAELICSVNKVQSKCFYFQYLDGNRKGTLRSPRDFEVEILGKENNILTLSKFLQNHRYSTNKPIYVDIVQNDATKRTYKITEEFWSQNYNNIRLKGLTRNDGAWKIPGASKVDSFKTA